MTANAPDPSDFLPLPSSEFRILLALVDGPAHGYGIMREVEHRSDGQVVIGPGTLYGAIRRMLGRGLIDETADRPGSEADDPRRRYYAITPLGRSVAQAEARRMMDLLGLAGEVELLPELVR